MGGSRAAFSHFCPIRSISVDTNHSWQQVVWQCPFWSAGLALPGHRDGHCGQWRLCRVVTGQWNLVSNSGNSSRPRVPCRVARNVSRVKTHEKWNAVFRRSLPFGGLHRPAVREAFWGRAFPSACSPWGKPQDAVARPHPRFPYAGRFRHARPDAQCGVRATTSD